MYQIDWNNVEAAFYHIMHDGWVSGRMENKEILVLDGYRVYAPSPDETYKLVDMWTRTSLSERSAGVTTLYQRFDVDWIPIWVMHYGGWYKPQASDFLKCVLRLAYENPPSSFEPPHNFWGCRGPHTSEVNDFVYQNQHVVGPHFSFKSFEGWEQVLLGQERVGYHQYFGMSLVG